MDLVVKIKGQIVESNFDNYYQELMESVKVADKALTTDQDFVWATDFVKRCKDAEYSIDFTKKQALSQTVEINKLFTKMDELSYTIRATRLSLEKKIKTEKENRRNQIIENGFDKMRELLFDVTESCPAIADHYIFSQDQIRHAVKGVKTEATMINRIDEWIEQEREKIIVLADIINDNMEIINNRENEYPGLFPDKFKLAGKSRGEVQAIIESRIAQFELARTKKEQAKSVQEETPVVQEKTKKVESLSVQKESYLFVATLDCDREKAISIAQKMAALTKQFKEITTTVLKKA